MDLPTTRYKTPLWHVGYMEGKPWPTQSHEGPLLSCSSCPSDWRAIARLGEAETWRIKPTPQLLDYHKLTNQHRTALLQQAQKAGLIIPSTLFKACCSYDEEDDEPWFILTETYAEAEKECIDGQPEPFAGYIPQPKLNHYWTGAEPVNLASVETAAITQILSQNAEIDGILWNDNYEPEKLSAPRVGIYPDRIRKINKHPHHIILQTRKTNADR